MRSREISALRDVRYRSEDEPLPKRSLPLLLIPYGGAPIMSSEPAPGLGRRAQKEKFLSTVKHHYAAAARRLGLNTAQYTRLLNPEKTISVSIPLSMDDGTTKHFDAWRVVHSTRRGPGKGGIRFAPMGVDTVLALAADMPAKPAIYGLPLGGAKGGVDVDPTSLSSAELARLMRGYVRAVLDAVYAESKTVAFGAAIDIPAPDVGTSPPEINLMDVAADEFIAWSSERGLAHVPSLGRIDRDPSGLSTPHADAYVAMFDRGEIANLELLASFTGKSLRLHGSRGRAEATGRGVAYSTLEVLGRSRFDDETIAIQGFGNVGAGAARAYAELGAKVVAIAERDRDGASYAIEKRDGFSASDIDALEAYKRKHRTLRGFPDATEIDLQRFWSMDVDVLAPCAAENVITEENAPSIRAKVIVEGANGPTTEEADAILSTRDVQVVPDIFANAAGVLVSYFEMMQNVRGEQWTLEEVRERLARAVHESYVKLAQTSATRSISLREAAFEVAVAAMSNE